MAERLNVRCCCQPQKILGTLEVEDSARSARHVRVYKYVRYPSIPLHYDADEPVSFEYEDPRVDVEVRTFCDYRNGERITERAIYSDDRPIEFWREIRGFQEAQHG